MQKTIHIRFKSHIINIVDAPKMAEKGGNANESSAVVLVACGKSKVLLTGDATSEIELAAAAAPIRSDVLKVSHHGSSTSSEMAFLKRYRLRLPSFPLAGTTGLAIPMTRSLNAWNI